MTNQYTEQDRGDQNSYQQYLEAMDAISIEKVASASAFFEMQAGNTIVDVGMASGTSSAILAQLFPAMNIVGIDINPKMVEIAEGLYKYPNLRFRVDDGEKLDTLEKDSVDGFFNCSAIHHITSYNGYDSNKAFNTLQRQYELLRNRGVIVVRDFVKPDQKEVIIDLSSLHRSDRPDDAELFIQFSKTSRSLSPSLERGFPIQEIVSRKNNIRRFKAFYSDVVEFIRRKDYYSNWDIELQEEYGYYTQLQFEEVFRELGLRIILSSPIYNQWIINNRYKGQFSIYDLSGKEIGFPPTNYLIAGEKVSGGKQIQLVRHLPLLKDSFLQETSYLNTKTGEVYDVVERPNFVCDIIPYCREDNQLVVFAKHSYPRPLVNIETSSSILDGKHYGGYVTEAISISCIENLEGVLEKRFGIGRDTYREISQSLNYYTSPGGINEKVSSKFIELERNTSINKKLIDGFSDFKESGYIHKYNAKQLLNTAQTGALIEARLELNIYNLFFKNEEPLPKWLGEKVRIKFESISSKEITSFSDLFYINTNHYKKTENKAKYLETHRAYFSEIGVENSNAILEYVHPSELSVNTLVTLPVLQNKGQIYVGLEIRHLPVPQLYSGNASIITAPAKRLPKDIHTVYELEEYIQNLNFGKAKIKGYSRLGDKYFPSIGVTNEQVYPYLVCLSRPTKDFRWVSLTELYQDMDKIEDAHLLICLCRLIHAIDFLPQKQIQDLRFEDFVNFIDDRYDYAGYTITRDTLVVSDLGITGDDGVELLEAIEEEFDIDFSNESSSLAKAFHLKENEYLFEGEGSHLSLFRKDKSIIIPLTVGQLYDVVVQFSQRIKK